MPIKLKGPWKQGFAYDIHTLYSKKTPSGWDNAYTDMGDLVHQIKYQNIDLATAQSVSDQIIELLLWDDTLKALLKSVDLIVPIPPTKERAIQPVHLIAQKLGQICNLNCVFALKKQGSSALKGIKDPLIKRHVLRKEMKLFELEPLKNKNILLFDDVYQSGSTVGTAAKFIYEQSDCRDVFVLTLTKTRKEQ